MKLIKKILVTWLTCLTISVWAENTTLIVPSAPGGLFHNTALALQPVLSKILQQPVVFDFKPGANGIIGARALISNNTKKISLLIGSVQTVENFEINQINDMIPIVDLGTAPGIIVANPGSEIKNLQDLLTKDVQLGIPLSSANVIWVNGLQKNHNNKLTTVPYKNAVPIVSDVIGGHIQAGIATPFQVAQHIAEGRLVGIAIIGSGRSNMIPNLPTAEQQGIKFKNYLAGYSNLMIWANHGADADTVELLRRELTAWSRTTEANDLFKKIDIHMSGTFGQPTVRLKQIFNQ
jgi:tripartite-type tricarboxylate transporter receptor subunit TctC